MIFTLVFSLALINCYGQDIKKTEITKEAPKYEQLELVKLAKNYYEKGDYEEAIRYLKKAIAIYPDFDEPYNNLGVVYMSIGEYEKAINNFKKAIELSPNYDRAHYNLGLIYKRRGDIKLVLEQYQKLTILNPVKANALLSKPMLLSIFVVLIYKFWFLVTAISLLFFITSFIMYKRGKIAYKYYSNFFLCVFIDSLLFFQLRIMPRTSMFAWSEWVISWLILFVGIYNFFKGIKLQKCHPSQSKGAV